MVLVVQKQVPPAHLKEIPMAAIKRTEVKVKACTSDDVHKAALHPVADVHGFPSGARRPPLFYQLVCCAPGKHSRI